MENTPGTGISTLTIQKLVEITLTIRVVFPFVALGIKNAGYLKDTEE
jgi:hypothetical protein